MKKRVVLLTLFLILWPRLDSLGQQSEWKPFQDVKDKKTQATPPPSQKPAKKPLSNADVIAMVKAGLAESTIVLAIQKNGGSTDFDTSPQALISLKDQGVPQKVLDAMLTAGTEKTAIPAGPTDRAATNATGGQGSAGGGQTGQTGKWHVSEDVSPIDGERTVFLSLQAEKGIPSLALNEFPLLAIRCKSKHGTNVFVHTGSLPFNPDRGGGFAVRLRLDDGQPFAQYWDESDSYDSLFAPNPVEFAKQLAASKKLALEFTPLGSGPVATWFDLAGLEGPLGNVAEACGWITQGASTEGSAPELRTIRKIVLETNFDSYAMRANLEKHTCLQVVDDRGLADGILNMSVGPFLGAVWKLLSKDGQVLWEKRSAVKPPFGPLSDAVGCQH